MMGQWIPFRRSRLVKQGRTLNFAKHAETDDIPSVSDRGRGHGTPRDVIYAYIITSLLIMITSILFV